MKKLKYVKTFESFKINENDNYTFDKIIEDVNNYLQDPKFINVISKLPRFIKNKMVNFVEQNGFDIDLIQETIEKYNLVQKVKSIYDRGVRDVNGFIDSLLGAKPATVNEEIGLFGGTVIVVIAILAIGVLSQSEGILGFGLVIGVPLGIACLIAVLCGADNPPTTDTNKEDLAKPGTEYVMNSKESKKVLENTIKYKGETNDFIVMDNGDGTYTLLKNTGSGTYKPVNTK